MFLSLMASFNFMNASRKKLRDMTALWQDNWMSGLGRDWSLLESTTHSQKTF